jgi:alanine racemase
MRKYLFSENYEKKLLDISDNDEAQDFFTESQSREKNRGGVGFLAPSAWLEIDLGQFKRNYGLVQKRVGKRVQIISILKADAYGHGLIPIAGAISWDKTAKIGLASLEEACILRNQGVTVPLLLLYPPSPDQIKKLIDLDVEMTLDNPRSFAFAEESARKSHKVAKVHAQINTGLNRYGLDPVDLPVFSQIATLKNVSIESVWTHFTDGSNNKLSAKQLSLFLKCLKGIAARGVHVKGIHVANSAAIAGFKDSFDEHTYSKIFPKARISVRPGCLLFGTAGDALNTKAILNSFVSIIKEIREIPKGGSVGYFQDYIANREIKAGILPVGWGNCGYLPERPLFLQGGKYAAGIGLISSNNMAVNLSKMPDASVGTRGFLIRSGDSKISQEKIAGSHHMFLNRFVSIIGSKVQRVYFE